MVSNYGCSSGIKIKQPVYCEVFSDDLRRTYADRPDELDCVDIPNKIITCDVNKDDEAFQLLENSR